MGEMARYYEYGAAQDLDGPGYKIICRQCHMNWAHSKQPICSLCLSRNHDAWRLEYQTRQSNWEKTRQAEQAYYNSSGVSELDASRHMAKEFTMKVNKSVRGRARTAVKKWCYAGMVSVVGGKYHGRYQAANEGRLKSGALMVFKREPQNSYDSAAIRAEIDGIHVGYVKREQNPLLAAVMDLGIEARGELVADRVDFLHSRVYIGKA